jgi:hypothetical protein
LVALFGLKNTNITAEAYVRGVSADFVAVVAGAEARVSADVS